MTETRITSLDVARLAGVSQSAVSRVFTPGASASKKTSQKVRKAAKVLGYSPNILARAVVSGKSRIIGLLVAYLENHFYPEALEKLSNALQREGYHVLVCLTSQKHGKIDHVVDEMLDYQVDGIVIASVAISSDIAQRCQNAGVPVVQFNRYEDCNGIAAITSENFHGGRTVAEFLLAGGHGRIAYIAGWEGASTQRDREAGFHEGLKSAKRDLFARKVGNFDFDQARAAARAMFDVPINRRPDALFVANDHMAFAVMDVIRHELGLCIPGNVSVVGFDDVPPAAWLSYNLTTVRQRTRLMVEETVKVLLAQIETIDADTTRRIAIDAPLVVRGSARIPEGWTDK